MSRPNSTPSSALPGSLAALVLGAVAMGVAFTIEASKSASKGASSDTTQEQQHAHQQQRKRDRKKHSFERIVPRGEVWWALSNDWADADQMPRTLQISADDARTWESLPVYSSPDDPFHAHENFVEALVASKKARTDDVEQIMKDIPRTFPDEEYFTDADVQDSLRRVLLAVSVEYQHIGYVQSMNFLVAFLLVHAKTEDAVFALFRRLMSHPRFRMEDLYKPGLPLLHRLIAALEVLVAKHQPACHAQFVEVSFPYQLVCQTWFMTLFLYSMDWETLAPVWDLFFERGWEGPLRIALFLIQENAARLQVADFEGCAAIIREAAGNAPVDIAAQCLGIPFDEDDLRTVRQVHLPAASASTTAL